MSQLDLFSTPEPPADETISPIRETIEPPGETLGPDGEPTDPFGTVLACIAFAQGLACPLLDRIRELGRLPWLSDDVKPWTLKGWLLPMVIDPRPDSRWYWWLETQCARRVLRPIPGCDFEREDDRTSAYKNLQKTTQLLAHARGSAPDLVIEWLAWGLGVAGSELPRLELEHAEILYRELNLNLWHDNPADHLGHLLCEHKGRGYDPAAFFPTPMELCTLMAGMAMPGEPSIESAAQAVMDPCVGTGRFLLVASNYSARLSGQDIQRRCVLATLVNGAVYAPWLAFPFPERTFAERIRVPAEELFAEAESAAATLLAE